MQLSIVCKSQLLDVFLTDLCKAVGYLKLYHRSNMEMVMGILLVPASGLKVIWLSLACEALRGTGDRQG